MTRDPFICLIIQTMTKLYSHDYILFAYLVNQSQLQMILTN